MRKRWYHILAPQVRTFHFVSLNSWVLRCQNTWLVRFSLSSWSAQMSVSPVIGVSYGEQISFQLSSAPKQGQHIWAKDSLCEWAWVLYQHDAAAFEGWLKSSPCQELHYVSQQKVIALESQRTWKFKMSWRATHLGSSMLLILLPPFSCRVGAASSRASWRGNGRSGSFTKQWACCEVLVSHQEGRHYLMQSAAQTAWLLCSAG